MRALALVLALWAAGVTPAEPKPAGAPPGFTQLLRPETVELGEPFIQSLDVTHTPDQRYELRLPKTTGSFELLKQDRRREDSGGKAVTHFELSWAAFALGKQPMPPVTFEVFNATGKPARFSPPPLDIDVRESAPGSGGAKEPFDIRGPVPVAVRTLRLLYAALALFVAVALGIYAWRRYRRWKSTRKAPPLPPLPLGLRTQMALDALKNEKLAEKGRGRELYFRLSELLRGYLGERYGFEALECTSEELMAALALKGDATVPLAEVEGFVRGSDWIKYAQAPTDLEGCREALAFAHRLVQVTTPPTAHAERT